METTYDTVIIGGGVIGCSIAYQLAKRGLRPLVIEKQTLGSQATQAGAGMLGAQVEMPAPDAMYHLGVASRSLYKELQSELKDASGVDIELQTPGILRLAASEEDRTSLLASREWQTQSGQKTEWLEDEELRQQFGDIFGPTYGALYLPDDHQVRNIALLRAFVVAASRLGATFIEHTEVTGFLRQGERITGVETSNGKFEADQVVLAAGAWSGLLGRLAGFELPVFPLKGQAVLANTQAPITPFTVFTHGTYMVPKLNSQLYIGATMERVGFDDSPNVQGVAQILTNAIKVMPQVKQLAMAGNLVGLRPGSIDGIPFFGEVPGLEGMLVASGHLRNGILLAPITGLILADLVTGYEPSFDITSFKLSRLSK